MSVTPLALDMTESGTNNKATLRVHNDGAAPIPVEVGVSRLFLDEKGESRTEPVTGKFVVFPPQATIPPGATQSFRVQWLGGPGLEATESFLFSVNQVPVVFDASKSGVQLVFNFSVLVNVSPMNGQAAIKLVATGVTDRKPVITIENTGSRHALLGDGAIVLTSGSWTKTVTGAELRDAIGGLGLVQPGKRRRFTLGVNIPSQISQFDARISIADKR